MKKKRQKTMLQINNIDHFKKRVQIRKQAKDPKKYQKRADSKRPFFEFRINSTNYKHMVIKLFCFTLSLQHV